MFNWNTHLRETAAHLHRMACEPGWLDHAVKRRDELLADPMYGEQLRKQLLVLQREARAKK